MLAAVICLKLSQKCTLTALATSCKHLASDLCRAWQPSSNESPGQTAGWVEDADPLRLVLSKDPVQVICTVKLVIVIRPPVAL